jgi:pimeloyl-ACP methyl ester carboxylesterase
MPSAAAALLELSALTPTILIGCSLGSMIVIEALRQADPKNHSILGACLISTAAKLESAADLSRRHAAVERYLEHPDEQAPAVNPARLAKMIDPETRAEVADKLQSLLQRATLGDLARHNLLVANRPDQRPHLAQLGRFPILIVAGSSDHAMTPRAEMEVMSHNIPGAVFVAIERCGHLPPLEQPDTVTRLIRTFLNRIACPD